MLAFPSLKASARTKSCRETSGKCVTSALGYSRIGLYNRVSAMVHHVKDLSSDQRLAIESLLGRSLRDNESVTIRPAVVGKDAPQGEERARLVRQYQKHLDTLAERVSDVPEEEIDQAIDEAIRQSRQQAQ
jgi:hypothetical protein